MIRNGNVTPHAIVPIKRVTFSLLSPQEIERYAVCEITKPTNRNNPLGSHETPYDKRMGVISNGDVCLSCNQKNSVCPGHFGMIKLAEPVYNPNYISNVLKVLSCVCPHCYRIKNPITDQTTNLAKSVELLYKKLKNVNVCKQCDESTPCYRLDKMGILYFYHINGKSAAQCKKYELSAKQAQTIFLSIEARDPQTLTTLGFNKPIPGNNGEVTSPLNYLFTVLPVLPPGSRPWVMSGNDRRDDDLTDKYNSIVKVNTALQNKNISVTEKKKQLSLLQMHVWTLIDNKKKISRLSNGGRPHKSLIDRMGKKEGRIQTNIGGKRVDFTGRNVICGAGSMLRVNEFGIPPHVYKILTKPERVSSRNIDYCQELVNTNQANFVRRGKNVINLKVVTRNFTVPYKIYPGDVVERHLKDGDIVLVNRQPTLRKESIQAFYVKRITGNREPFGPFRLPLPVTCGFNADFDGSTL